MNETTFPVWLAEIARYLNPRMDHRLDEQPPSLWGELDDDELAELAPKPGRRMRLRIDGKGCDCCEHHA